MHLVGFHNKKIRKYCSPLLITIYQSIRRHVKPYSSYSRFHRLNNVNVFAITGQFKSHYGSTTSGLNILLGWKGGPSQPGPI